MTTEQEPYYAQRFAVAPMLDWTTRHCRAFHRQLTKHAILYTEMVATSTVLHSKSDPLYFRPEYEGDVILQLGGSEPKDFAKVAQILHQRRDELPYAGVNINVGCPSPRVTSGSFGACLMAEPDLVAQCADALLTHCELPISIKTRIGIDNKDSYAFLEDFILANMEVGIMDFIIHARKAYLQGLSPKENRDVPPLNYQRVYDLADEYPELNIVINGGINDLQQAKEHLAYVDGVMMGREAYNNPATLLGVDAHIFQDFDNDYYNYTKIFAPQLGDTVNNARQEIANRVVNPRFPHDHFSSRLYQSISGGFNMMYSQYNPMIAQAEELQEIIYRLNHKRMDDALARGDRFAKEFMANPRPKHTHVPKGVVTEASRIQRLDTLATTQAMFNALDRLRPYWESEYKENKTAISHLFKPMLGAFNGVPGARNFRRYLSEHGFVANAPLDELYYAIDFMYDKFVSYTESST